MELDTHELAGVVSRLKRVQGQIGGVVAMIEDGRECEDVVTQLAAAARALDRAGYKIIASGMRRCVSDPDNAIDEQALERLFLSLA